MLSKASLIIVLFILIFLEVSCGPSNLPSDKMEGMMANKRKVEKTIEIAAPVAAVWKALTEAEELRNWFPLDAGVEPGLGGKIRLSWRDKFEWVMKIDVWLTEKHLRLVYSSETDFTAKAAQKKGKEVKMISEESNELAIDYYLEAHAGKTVLRLVHSGFGADSTWDEEYEGVSRGWSSELGSLKHYLENHRGEDRSVAWASVQLKESVESAWEKLIGPDGFDRNGTLKSVKEGDAYEIQAVTGEIFRGKILYLNSPLDFMATVDNRQEAILRVKIEQYQGIREADVWLSGYGLSEAEIKDFEERWAEKLEELLN